MAFTFSQTIQPSAEFSKNISSSISPRFAIPAAISQYDMTMRKLALSSLPIGYFEATSCGLPPPRKAGKPAGAAPRDPPQSIRFRGHTARQQELGTMTDPFGVLRTRVPTPRMRSQTNCRKAERYPQRAGPNPG